jgi:hypothetical protein
VTFSSFVVNFGGVVGVVVVGVVVGVGVVAAENAMGIVVVIVIGDFFEILVVVVQNPHQDLVDNEDE